MSHTRQILERMALVGRRADIVLKRKRKEREALSQQENVILQPLPLHRSVHRLQERHYHSS